MARRTRANVDTVFTTFWDDEPLSWDYIYIEDKRFVGTIEAEPARKLQSKNPPGSDGIRYTDKGYDAKDVKVKLRFWTRQHLADWDEIVPRIQPKHVRLRDAQPLHISHPSTDQLGINQVIVESMTNLRHEGKRIYYVDISFKQYKPPTRRNVTQRVDIVISGLEGIADETAFYNPPPPPSLPSQTNTNP